MVVETELLPEYEIPNKRLLICSDLAEGMSKGYKMFELVSTDYIYDILADCAKHQLIRMIRDIYLVPKWNVYKNKFYEKYDYDKSFIMKSSDVDRMASKHFMIYNLYSPELKRCRVFVELYISEDTMDKDIQELSASVETNYLLQHT